MRALRLPSADPMPGALTLSSIVHGAVFITCAMLAPPFETIHPIDYQVTIRFCRLDVASDQWTPTRVEKRDAPATGPVSPTGRQSMQENRQLLSATALAPRPSATSVVRGSTSQSSAASSGASRSTPRIFADSSTVSHSARSFSANSSSADSGATSSNAAEANAAASVAANYRTTLNPSSSSDQKLSPSMSDPVKLEQRSLVANTTAEAVPNAVPTTGVQISLNETVAETLPLPIDETAPVKQELSGPRQPDSRLTMVGIGAIRSGSPGRSPAYVEALTYPSDFRRIAKTGSGVTEFVDQQRVATNSSAYAYDVGSYFRKCWNVTAAAQGLRGDMAYCQAVFRIGRQGEMQDVQIERPSGNPALDGSVVDMLCHAAPCPQFSATMPDWIEVHKSFGLVSKKLAYSDWAAGERRLYAEPLIITDATTYARGCPLPARRGADAGLPPPPVVNPYYPVRHWTPEPSLISNPSRHFSHAVPSGYPDESNPYPNRYVDTKLPYAYPVMRIRNMPPTLLAR